MSQWAAFEVNYKYDDGEEWFEPVLRDIASRKSWVYDLSDAKCNANPKALMTIFVTANSFETGPGFRSMHYMGAVDDQGKDSFEAICDQVNQEGRVQGGAEGLKKKFWGKVKEAGILLGQKGNPSSSRGSPAASKQGASSGSEKSK